MRFVAAAAIFSAGVIHLFHGVQQQDPLMLVFFIVVGLIQVVAAGGIALERRWALLPSIFLNTVLIGLFVTVHFEEMSLGAFEPIGVAAKSLEALAVVFTVMSMRNVREKQIAVASLGDAGDSAQTASGTNLALSRRQLLRAGSLGAAGMFSGALVSRFTPAHGAEKHVIKGNPHFGNAAKGSIDLSRFNPTSFLRDFDYGKTSTLPDGRTLREFRLTAVDIEIEVAPGVTFPAWAYNNRVPGPTLRATEGDLVRVHFTNAGSHPHTIHFHGFHQANMDGVFEIIEKGKTFTYEFEAAPFGLHLYHCHVPPLKRHIHKGLYGVFIVDPKQGRPPADELVMMMNAFDTNLDGENEIYAVNTVAHYYMHTPIRIAAGALVRAYVVNITEFDLINSVHIHANFFNEYRTGTKLEPDNYTDTIILGQGERSIIEFTYNHPGTFMFHAHVSEFAELGWAGLFEVS